jgi:hypothetical protein
MGRRCDLTKTLQAKIAKHLRAGNSVKDTCDFVGIGETAFYEWIKRGDRGDTRFVSFAKVTRRARADGRGKCVNTIKTAAREGDWKAAAWFLERSDPVNWGRQDFLKYADIVRELLDGMASRTPDGSPRSRTAARDAWESIDGELRTGANGAPIARVATDRISREDPGPDALDETD